MLDPRLGALDPRWAAQVCRRPPVAKWVKAGLLRADVERRMLERWKPGDPTWMTTTEVAEVLGDNIRAWVIQQLEEKIQAAQDAGDHLEAQAAQTELEEAQRHQQAEGRTVLAYEATHAPRCSKDREEWPCPRLRNIAAQFEDKPGWDPTWAPVIAGG